MGKSSKSKILISASLLVLLLGSKVKLDKDMNLLNNRIIEWGTTETSDLNLIAHRGYSSMYPDNSKEAIEACKDFKCLEGIECDVRLTKDNKLVLFHDDYIGFRPIRDYTFEELSHVDNLSKKISTKSLFLKGYSLKESALLTRRQELKEDSSCTLCTLEDVLNTRDQNQLLLIDIKFSGYQDDYLLGRIGELCKGQENVIIQSFNKNRLRQMKELYPDYMYQLLIDTKKELDSIDYEFDAYGIKYATLEDDTVKGLIDHDKVICLWTVDNEKELQALLKQYGVYQEDIHFISDNPDMIGYQYEKNKG